MGNAHDERAGEGAVRAPAHNGHFIAHLVDGWPDVVEELDLNDGLEAAHGHADGATGDVCLGQWGVEDAVGAELRLQAAGEFEDAALALECARGKVLVAAGVGHVFAEDDDARVASHFVAKRRVDAVGHGAVDAVRIGGGLRRVEFGCGIEEAGGGCQVFGVDVLFDVSDEGQRRRQGAVGGEDDGGVDVCLNLPEFVFGEDALPDEVRLELADGGRAGRPPGARRRGGRRARRRFASGSRGG